MENEKDNYQIKSFTFYVDAVLIISNILFTSHENQYILFYLNLLPILEHMPLSFLQ